jgi:hypothetical protein
MMGEELLNVFIIFIASSIFNVKIENECYEKMDRHCSVFAKDLGQLLDTAKCV